jgi:hypothetical protein
LLADRDVACPFMSLVVPGTGPCPTGSGRNSTVLTAAPTDASGWLVSDLRCLGTTWPPKVGAPRPKAGPNAGLENRAKLPARHNLDPPSGFHTGTRISQGTRNPWGSRPRAAQTRLAGTAECRLCRRICAVHGVLETGRTRHRDLAKVDNLQRTRTELGADYQPPPDPPLEPPPEPLLELPPGPAGVIAHHSVFCTGAAVNRSRQARWRMHRKGRAETGQVSGGQG